MHHIKTAKDTIVANTASQRCFEKGLRNDMSNIGRSSFSSLTIIDMPVKNKKRYFGNTFPIGEIYLMLDDVN